MSVDQDADDQNQKFADAGVSVPVPEPDELHQRDQWLMWDDADSPRRPHWRGDFSISWNDPDDWHTFDEAREAALTRDS